MSDAPSLIRSRTILDRQPDLGDLNHQYFRQTPDEEGDRSHQLALDVEVWREMGRPEVVTFTIEPGDLLNGEGGEGDD